MQTEFCKTVLIRPEQKGTCVDVNFPVAENTRSVTMQVEYPMEFPK